MAESTPPTPAERAAKLTVPRIPKGKGMKGPEPFGCFNTGTAPTICRSLSTGKYVVGAQNDVEEVRRMILYRQHEHKRIFHLHIGKTRPCYVFKGRGTAVAKFRELCAAMFAMNDSMIAEYQQAKEDSKSKDPNKAMAGVLKIGLEF